MVPEGWVERPIDELTSQTVTYGVVKPGDEKTGGVPFVRGGDFPDGKILTASLRTISPEISDGYKRTILKGGEILVSLVGYPGAIAIVPNELVGANIARQAALVRPNQYVDRDYLFQFLRSPIGQKRMLSQTLGSAQQVINLKDLKAVGIPLPPLAEQKKIAEILSTWDRAIEVAEAQLEAARTSKRALMQQLLTGKRRFPEFEGEEWKEVRLGDVGVISSAGVDKKANPDEPEVRLLNFLDVHRREFLFDHELEHVVTAPVAKVEKCDVRKGDVFFTPSSETRDDIAIPAVAAEDMDGVCYSYHIVRFRLRERWDLNFRAFIFQTDDFRRQAYRLGDGSGQRYVISQDNFRNMVVSVPSVKEQEKIGAVIKDISDEILNLSDTVTKLRTEKKALMKQLLTGKRRVVV